MPLPCELMVGLQIQTLVGGRLFLDWREDRRGKEGPLSVEECL